MQKDNRFFKIFELKQFLEIRNLGNILQNSKQ